MYMYIYFVVVVIFEISETKLVQFIVPYLLTTNWGQQIEVGWLRWGGGLTGIRCLICVLSSSLEVTQRGLKRCKYLVFWFLFNIIF